MERRKFIQTTGTFLTATALMSFTSKTGLNFEKSEGNNEMRKDNYNDFPTPILKAIAIGLNAPSAHNTQAWKFKIINDTEMMLYVDETRLLPKTDPPARQIHISCGSFLEALSIGCSAIGYKAEISLMPEGNYSLSEIGKKPVALVKLLDDKNVTKHPLFDYIFERRTNRTVYEGNLITNNEFSQISSESKTLYSKTIFINEPNEIEKYRNIFSKAMDKEFHTLATNEETRKMFRFNDKEASTQRDGLTFEANGLSGMGLFMARSFTKNTTESWNKKGTIEKGLAGFNKGLNSSKSFVFWTTQSNTILDQVNVGRDFYQFNLALAKNKMYLHPLNQANQEYAEMTEIRNELDKMVGIKDQEKIQMIVRIGRAEKPFESYRRHLDTFLLK
jgi:hypothetical protein